MMRTLVLAALFAGAIMAQTCPSGLTTVQDTVSTPAQSTGGARLLQGTVTVTPTVPFTSAADVTYGRIPYIFSVRAGAVFGCLAPNDTAVPSGTGYLVEYQHADAMGSAVWREIWVVPTSSTPVTVAAIRTTAAPTPGMTVPLSELQPPLTASSPLQLNPVTGVLSCTSCSGGGGGSSQCVNTVSYSATPTFDFSLCPQIFITLSGNIAPAVLNPQDCEIAGGCTITFAQTGAYTVTWAGNVHGGIQPGAINGKRSSQTFTCPDGSNLVSTGAGTVNQ